MRERKYKAWVKGRCEFFPVFEIDFYDKSVGVWGCGNENCGTCSDYFDFDEIELIEYTGRKDKNGVEVYEGDIISAYFDAINGKHLITYTVKYDEFHSLYPFEDFDHYEGPMYFTVIGNCYEKSEPLKEEPTC